MNRNLTIWIAGAMFVVFLPLLFIVLEGVTRPQRLSAARIGETEETTKSEQGVRTTSSEAAA